MKSKHGLRRQIVMSMSAAALGVIVLSMLGAYVFYYVLVIFSPQSISPPDAWPTAVEWTWMAATTVAALALAIGIAFKLARRILLPVTSVAASLRQLARGDLDARAHIDDRSPDEAGELVDDFNAMAERLQHLAREQRFWNAAIAHELRTPVTILRGRLQGLAEGVFTPDEAQFRSLLGQVESLGRLIEDLRVVSLADSGHLSLHIRAVDLGAVIEGVAGMAGPALTAAGHAVVLDLAPGIAHADPDRIGQALLALMANVCQHALPGQVRIGLQIEEGWCVLAVADAGPGIAAALLPDVFGAFWRAQDARPGGSGLGLAVVAAIAGAHGGIAACTQAAGGSVFTLRWPDRPAASSVGS